MIKLGIIKQTLLSNFTLFNCGHGVETRIVLWSSPRDLPRLIGQGQSQFINNCYVRLDLQFKVSNIWRSYENILSAFCHEKYRITV